MLKVYIDESGMEKIALGQPLYSWNYSVLEEDQNVDNKICVGEFNPTFPSPEDCIRPVLAALKKKEVEIQLEAAEEMKKIRDRRANLLALTYEGKV